MLNTASSEMEYNPSNRSICFCLGWLVAVLAPAAVSAQTIAELGARITVDQQGWGIARTQDIQKVLESAAAEFLRCLPERRVPIIQVRHSGDVPRVLYERGSNGEYVVQLSAKDRYWAQYSYQFGHELCHIVSNYDRNNANHIGLENQWFEESLCETASLFVVRKMGDSWETTPPYEVWRSFARELRRYVDDKLGQVERLPPGVTLPNWLARNLDAFRRDPYARPKNDVVAAALLPLFLERPENWAAVSWLNLGTPDESNSFRRYLENWYRACPKQCRRTVRQIADRLGIVLATKLDEKTPSPVDRR